MVNSYILFSLYTVYCVNHAIWRLRVYNI